MIVFGCVVSEDELMGLVGDDTRAKFLLERGSPMNVWSVVSIYEKQHPNLIWKNHSSAGKRAYVIGREYESMGMDETRGEFESSVIDEVREIFGKEISCFLIHTEERY